MPSLYHAIFVAGVLALQGAAAPTSSPEVEARDNGIGCETICWQKNEAGMSNTYEASDGKILTCVVRNFVGLLSSSWSERNTGSSVRRTEQLPQYLLLFRIRKFW